MAAPALLKAILRGPYRGTSFPSPAASINARQILVREKSTSDSAGVSDADDLNTLAASHDSLSGLSLPRSESDGEPANLPAAVEASVMQVGVSAFSHFCDGLSFGRWGPFLLMISPVFEYACPFTSHLEDGANATVAKEAVRSFDALAFMLGRSEGSELDVEMESATGNASSVAFECRLRVKSNRPLRSREGGSGSGAGRSSFTRLAVVFDVHCEDRNVVAARVYLG
eukprot:TRINITY_DN881_c0_g1_i2.p1 TRINITY_DN881_c0_g1~~TRINITY_DN881_c0_g1_i2.p1  ORF type:complete len:227 (+),score=20.39 TRINITY_DN881_c0_g1_i2:584-1264(+)